MTMGPATKRDVQYWKRVDEIFGAVLEAGPLERAARLDALCGGDPALRSDVTRLLESDRRVDAGFLEPGVAVQASSDDGSVPSLRLAWESHAADRWIGRRIGGFTLTRCLGAGGMGAVYEAVQDRPRRTVALKVLLGALGSSQRVRRFVAEAEILADLHHPNIAQVYEAGSGDDAPDAAPYMALELIPEATPITQYARERGSDCRAKLALFLQVCDAVQYLHQRGVIHRDLKPANILVDAAGRPRVIDFGVARLVESDPAATRLTDAKQLVGTVAYMSPEQVRGDTARMDTRCDVYALGVILFELLTGRPPYEVHAGNLAQALRAIECDVPPRPSSLDPSLRGDLETIILKALEKQPERRYTSVEALAEDIRRFRDGRIINARPPTLGYQMARLVSRHKAVSTLLGLLLVCLVGFSAAVGALYLRSERQRERAEQAERSSRNEAQSAREVADYLVNLFQSLDPWTGAGSDEGSSGVLSVLEVLDREARTIPEKLNNQPLTQADVLTALAGVYQRLEMYGRAAAALRMALEIRRGVLGANDPSIAKAAARLGGVLRLKGEYSAAELLLREAMRLHRRLDATHSELRFLAPSWLEELGVLVCSQGRFNEAETLVREALEAHHQLRDADDPNVLVATLTLARVLRLRGECAAAEVLCREVLDRCRRTLPEDDGLTLSAVLGLSSALRDQGNLAGAEEFLREARDLLLQSGGAESWEVFGMTVQVAALMQSRGDLEAAESLIRLALDLLRKRYGPDHPQTGALLDELVYVLAANGNVAGMQAIHAELLDHRERTFTLPEDHPARSGAALHLGVAMLAQGDTAGAEPLLRRCVNLRSAALSPEHWLTAYAESALGECLAAQSRYKEAEPLLLHGYHVVRAPLGRGDRRTLRALRRLVNLYEAWGRLEPDQGHEVQAAVWQARLDAHCLPEDPPTMDRAASSP